MRRKNQVSASGLVLSDGAVTVRRYGSLTELVEYGQNTPREWHSNSSDRRDPDQNAWSGSDSLAQAQDYALNGTWHCPDFGKLQGVLAEPASRENESRVEFTCEIMGVRPNVPAYLSGEPACMWQAQFAETARPIVRVLLNRGYTAAVDQNEALDAGVLILDFLNKLETQHHVATELTVATCTEFDDIAGTPQHVELIRVKRAGDVFDLAAIAFALVCPAMLRRLVFRARETLPRYLEQTNYGSSRDVPDAIRAEFDVYLPVLRAKEKGGDKALRAAIDAYMVKGA